MDGRPHRRCERGMEGARTVGDGEHARAVPHGDGRGDDEQGAALSTAPRPPGGVSEWGDVPVPSPVRLHHMPAPFIQISNLTRRFGTKTALDSVSLSLP